ncbi:MAG: purine-nucleoside phosphorylase [Oscillospiraceae bacterium]|nr:purine-nucleoside phosphorylase [Oscillospiraceae bacterium]
MSRDGAPTIHNEAKKGDIAETVLMPGDPLRAQFIAETFLKDITLFNNVRGMLGYTGTYNGKRVSVMGSGMGMPSIGIYSYELFHFYDVQNIIRVGSAGTMHPDVKLYDVVIGMGACHDSNFDKQFEMGCTFAPICSFELLEKAVGAAREKNIPVHVGNIISGDVFYSAATSGGFAAATKMGVLAGEMEAAALYMNAAYAGKNALCIVTISDAIHTGEIATPMERQTAFTKMMEVALELA